MSQHAALDRRLFERSEQLSALAAALSEVQSSLRGQLVLVAGEAGIGKTALVRSFLDDLNGAVPVLWAVCEPMLTPRPLGPLLDFAGQVDGELGEQLGAFTRPYDATVAFLRELAHKGPTVVVVDDAQWADEATLDVIRLLARRVGQVPVLLLMSYRDDGLSRAHPLQILLGDLPGRAHFKRVELGPLSQAAVAELAAPIGFDPGELHERTGGNPFFVTEVIAAGNARLPPTVRDAVLGRCARLSPSARSALDAAAVVPGRAEVWLLEAVAPDAAGSLEECLDAGVLVADRDSVMFRHELTRLVVEESLPPDKRAALHRHALAVLSHSAVGRVDLARLAYHAEAAGDSASVLRFAPPAAERAAMAGAHRAAAAEYARALRSSHHLTPQERARLLEALAGEAYLIGSLGEAATAGEDALAIHRDSGDRKKQGEALNLLARVYGALGRHQAAASAAEEAVAIFQQLGHNKGLAHAYAALSGVRGLSDDAEGLRLGRIANRLAQNADDNGTLIHVLNNVGVFELRRGSTRGLAKLDRSRRLAQEAGDELAVARAYVHAAWMLVHGRDCLVAERYLRAGSEYCLEHGFEAWLHWLTALDAECSLARGFWSAAEQAASAALDLRLGAQPQSRCVALIVLATLRARRGKNDDVWPLLDEAAELTKAGLPHLVAAVAVAQAELAWLQNRRPVVDDDAGVLNGYGAKLEPSFAYQLVCWRRRAGLVCDPPAHLPEPYSSQMRGDHQGAAVWWTEHGCPYEAALALYDSGSPAALRKALVELNRLGARPAAAIVARALRRAGESRLPRGPRPKTFANPGGLTARELEVLNLMAFGLANSDIADRLVVSLRTVEHHVTAILRKLNVHNRAEAGAFATQLGMGLLADS